MAKGDDSRSRNQVEYQTNLAQNNLNNLRTDTLIPQNQSMWNNYTAANQQNQQERGDVNARFTDFANTGGYSPMDISNIRSRAISPIRGIYAGANREVDRQRSLQGGYSPGYGVLKSRMAREQSSALSDASTNVEGMIAQLRNAGKQYGTTGLFNTYTSTPGLTNMFGNQALESTGQRLQGEQLQGNIGEMAIRGQLGASQLPGKFDSALQQIQGVANIGSTVGGTIYPWLRPEVAKPSLYGPTGYGSAGE
jgi:hypothetical protein